MNVYRVFYEIKDSVLFSCVLVHATNEDKAKAKYRKFTKAVNARFVAIEFLYTSVNLKGVQ